MSRTSSPRLSRIVTVGVLLNNDVLMVCSFLCYAAGQAAKKIMQQSGKCRLDRHFQRGMEKGCWDIDFICSYCEPLSVPGCRIYLPRSGLTSLRHPALQKLDKRPHLFRDVAGIGVECVNALSGKTVIGQQMRQMTGGDIVLHQPRRQQGDARAA